MGKQRKLVMYVEVDGVWYGPDDNVPAEVADKIVNPKAWAGYTTDAESAAKGRKAGTSSGARLARTVDVGGTAYGPDDYVPDHIAAQIVNPKAWEGGKVPKLAAVTAPEGGDTSGENPGTGSGAESPGEGAGGESPGTGSTDGTPPQTPDNTPGGGTLPGKKTTPPARRATGA